MDLLSTRYKSKYPILKLSTIDFIKVITENAKDGIKNYWELFLKCFQDNLFLHVCNCDASVNIML